LEEGEFLLSYFTFESFMQKYLEPTYFLDFDNGDVLAFAESNSDKNQNNKENAIQLYYAVRDGFKYNPYVLDLRKEGLKASSLLKKNNGYCIEKALLLAATARAIGIPSRLSFYIVANHIATGRIEKVLRTNKLVFHGATEFYLDEKWLKVTPAFDARLCHYLDVATLEFDGTEDAIFQQFDEKGNVFMEYLHSYGDFDDMPYDLAISEFIKHYPHIFDSKEYLKEKLVYNLAI
jgi:transglutaminase-like putative cysteine protease